MTTRETTEWKWEIKPKEFGRLPLHLSVNARLVLAGREMSRSIQTFDKTIVVTVSWPQTAYVFLHHNWQWLWTAIVIPVAGWMWHRQRARRG